MSRKGKGYTGIKRQLTSEELECAFDTEIDVLQSLCLDFDAGRSEYAFLLASQIQKILTEGQTATRRRGAVNFLTPVDNDGPDVLSARYLLTGIQIKSGDEPMGNFLPIFQLFETNKWNELKFSKWWGEPVYRASAALPGSPPGSIPVNDSPRVPYEKRERLSRRQIVQILRDHRGSHSLDDFPQILEEIDGPSSWGGFAIFDETKQKRYSTDDGSLKWGIGQQAAMIRQISWETLVAFGRVEAPSIAP